MKNYRKEIIQKAMNKQSGPVLGKPSFDFIYYEEKAKKMSDAELVGALNDIKKTLTLLAEESRKGADVAIREGWYSDERSTYLNELKRRQNGVRATKDYRKEIIKTAQEITPPKQKIPYEVWIKSKKSDGTTYEQWEKRLDRIISKKFGLGMLDFPDWLSGDAYEQNKTVEQGFNAFKRAQKDALGDLE